MTNQTQETNRPVAELRDGSMKIAIFQSFNNEGKVRYSHKLTRSYKDAQGQWQETAYTSGTENLRAANLYQLAYNKELELRAALKAQTQNQAAA